MVTGIVGNRNVSLTVNATSHNGLLCPEEAEWICKVPKSLDSVARFDLSNGSTNSTIRLNNMDQQLNIYYVLTPMKEGSYVISTLIVNNKELFNLGYTHLTCGTLAVTTNYSLALDMEGKNVCVHMYPCYLSELQ